MAKKIINPQLVEALRANPNAEKVTRKSVVFRASFINRALDQYLLGGTPRTRYRCRDAADSRRSGPRSPTTSTTTTT